MKLCRIVMAVVTCAVLASVSTGAMAATTLKFGTLMPQASPWGKEFKKWAAQVAADTNGDLTLDFQWNGQAGDEALMVQKVRAGQLDGAAVSAAGLSQTGVTDVLMFQLPGLFANWSKLDAVRGALKDDLDRQFESKGFTVLGWGDVGAAKTMSIGFEVHRPSDLQGKGTFVIAGDAVQPTIFSAIGGVAPRSLSITEILPGLTSGAVNVVTAPPLVAEELQWASHVTHISTQTSAFVIGALIASSPRMRALPQRLKDVMAARGAELSGRLATMVRNLDAQAFDRMKSTKKAYDLTDEDRAQWKILFDKVYSQVRGTVFTPATFDRVLALARQ
jgi:TRAP-type C4-dicarboxylate transport system substrate-binding protein